jgi:hypothetical protein
MLKKGCEDGSWFTEPQKVQKQEAKRLQISHNLSANLDTSPAMVGQPVAKCRIWTGKIKNHSLGFRLVRVRSVE